jgi:hypothetical protein
VSPADGAVVFAFPWRSRSNASVNAATPLVVGEEIFVSASYGTGAALLRYEDGKVKTIWSGEDSLDNHYATSVYRDGYLYGFHGRQEFGQSFRCVEWSSGKVAWEEGGFGAGTVTLAGERLLILKENGELVLADASPKSFAARARSRILTGTVRAYPALADGKLYARNEDTLICVDLKQQRSR